MTRSEAVNFDEYVTLRCNDCGEEIGFFPWRVVHLRGCDCGNSDYGSPRQWKDDKLGNFTLVKREEWKITIPYPALFF